MSLLVDFSQIVIGSYMTAAKHASTDIEVIRSAVLNTLRIYRVKFVNEYGELVLCCDDRHTWRKEIFPNYKAYSVNNYRIVRLAALHSLDAFDILKKKVPGYEKQLYSEQSEILFGSHVLYSDSFSRAFRKLGNESWELVWDFEELQKGWAVENGIRFDEGDWIPDILVAQIEKIRPDVVYFQGTELAIPGRFRKGGVDETFPTILKKRFPFIRIIAMFSGFPSSPSRIRDIDILFTGSPALRDHYSRFGVESVLCYHAFDESILIDLVDQLDYMKLDFTFLGSTRAPESRYWALRKLLEETDIEIWADEPILEHKKSFIKKKYTVTKNSLRDSLRRSPTKIIDLIKSESGRKVAMSQ